MEEIIFITAVVIFMFNGSLYHDEMYYQITFNNQLSCDLYLEANDSLLRLNLTKMFNAEKIELKEIVKLFCSEDK